VHYDARIVTGKRSKTPVRARLARPATALLILAVTALVISVLHGAVPHQNLPGPCHDCEALAPIADLSTHVLVATPFASVRSDPPRAAARLVEAPERWLGPPRAPPTSLAA